MLRGASLFSVSAERREPPSRHSLGCESHHPEQIGHASLGRHEDQQKLDASSSASSFRRPCTGSFKAVSHVARLTLISNLTSIVEVLHHLPLPGKTPSSIAWFGGLSLFRSILDHQLSEVNGACFRRNLRVQAGRIHETIWDMPWGFKTCWGFGEFGFRVPQLLKAWVTREQV